MLEDILLPIIVVFIVVGLPVICGTLISLAKIMRGESGRKTKTHASSSSEEAMILQDIHRTLSKLESRIDSLETIVLENPTRKS